MKKSEKLYALAAASIMIAAGGIEGWMEFGTGLLASIIIGAVGVASIVLAKKYE